MADKRDYYEVLGVGKNATDAELKKAFFKIAKENHPDLHPGDKECEQRLKEANEAYEVLSDKDKRAKYDQFGFAGVDPNFAASNGGGFSGGFDGFDLGDILGSVFSGFGGDTARNRNAPMRGESIRVGVSISFEEAAFGCDKRITVSRTETCDECGGNGCAQGTTPEVCPTCHGSGVVMTQKRTMFGVMQSSAECPKCGGRGKIIHQPCGKCHGSGTVRKQKTINVTIPAGIDNNQTFALRGQGHAGLNGGPAGDILVTVSVRPHEFFKREGFSILYEMPISVTQALLGADLEVPTLDGKVKYSIPEGTQSGDVFRLKGKGVPYRNGRGDQYVTIKINIPKELTNEQRELVKKLDESLGGGAGGDSKPHKFKRKK
ncbi:MAG: molecular chaperone DnaJ [Oscillospiraceae bacterium]